MIWVQTSRFTTKMHANMRVDFRGAFEGKTDKTMNTHANASPTIIITDTQVNNITISVMVDI